MRNTKDCRDRDWGNGKMKPRVLGTDETKRRNQSDGSEGDAEIPCFEGST